MAGPSRRRLLQVPVPRQASTDHYICRQSPGFQPEHPHVGLDPSGLRSPGVQAHWRWPCRQSWRRGERVGCGTVLGLDVSDTATLRRLPDTLPRPLGARPSAAWVRPPSPACCGSSRRRQVRSRAACDVRGRRAIVTAQWAGWLARPADHWPAAYRTCHCQTFSSATTRSRMTDAAEETTRVSPYSRVMQSDLLPTNNNTNITHVDSSLDVLISRRSWDISVSSESHTLRSCLHAWLRHMTVVSILPKTVRDQPFQVAAASLSLDFLSFPSSSSHCKAALWNWATEPSERRSNLLRSRNCKPWD